jgi:hypothetical protein
MTEEERYEHDRELANARNQTYYDKYVHFISSEATY